MARPRKLSDEELLKIVEKYIIEKPYIVSLKYTDLAKYSQEELGIENITYQDFSRNKKIKEAVEIYKKQKDMTMYIKLNSDKLEKLNFNVENIVEKYKNDPRQLKVILKVFKDGYDRAFDAIIEYDNCNKKNRDLIKEQEKAIKELKEKNKELRNELNKKVEVSKENKVTEAVEIYKKQKDMTMYIKLNSDKLEKLNFNVENIVEKYKNDPRQLKVILKVFKDGYDRAFDAIIEYDNCNKKNRDLIKEQEKAIKELKEKNKELRNELNKKVEVSKENKVTEKLKWMYLLLNDMINQKNCRIETKDDIIEILKNFGYSKSDTGNIEDILKSELKNKEDKIPLDKNEEYEKLSQENKVISINKNRLELPDFMK